MTTSELIKKLESLADIGIVNAKEDAKTLREAAARLYEMREQLDPKWNDWMIVDEGLLLAHVDGEESEWTPDKNEAIVFENEDDANEFVHTILGYGQAIIRGDYDPKRHPEIFFEYDDDFLQ